MPPATAVVQCGNEDAHGEHVWQMLGSFPSQCPGFVGRAGVPARDWGEWTPGKGLERIRAEMPGLIPEVTDEDLAKADALIAAAPKPSETLTWVCTRCAGKLSGNPRQCPACGYTVYKPTWGSAPVSEEPAAGPSLLAMIHRYGAKRVNQEVVPNDRNAAAVREMVDLIEARINIDQAAAHARGISEGLRRADNAIDWQTSCLGCSDRLDGLIEERGRGYEEGLAEGRRQATQGWERHLRWRTAEGSTTDLIEPNVAAYVGMSRRLERQYEYAPGELQQRLVGPWEPAEQPEPGVCNCESYEPCHGECCGPGNCTCSLPVEQPEDGGQRG
jgi:hypothetical protein